MRDTLARDEAGSRGRVSAPFASRRVRWLLCAASLATSQVALAGRPLFTDDATVTPTGACQAESWYQDNAHGYELNVFPACNLVGNVEITLGLTRRDAANSYSLQGKKIFREFEPDSWGWGLAVGAIHYPSQEPQSPTASDIYAYVPLSVSFAEDRYQLHLNAGVNHHQPDDNTTLTWGIGGVANLDFPVMLFAEVFGSDDLPSIHGGLGLALLPDRVQLDLTAGRTLRGGLAGNFASIGLNVYLPPF